MGKHLELKIQEPVAGKKFNKKKVTMERKMTMMIMRPDLYNSKKNLCLSNPEFV